MHKISGVVPGGGTLRPWLHRCRGVKIGKNVWISQYVYIDELHPEAVFIGDTRHDAEVAGEIGVDCILIPNGHHTVERLRKCDCTVIGSLSELLQIFSPQKSQ